MKTMIVSAAFTIAAAAGLMLTAPAHADPPADACADPPCQRPSLTGCPGGFDNRSVPDVVLADPSREVEILAEDQNADNRLCFKLLPNGNILFMDNDR